MTIGFVFWLIMLILLLFGGHAAFTNQSGSRNPINLVLYVLLFLLGWKVFGFPIQG